MSTTLQLRRGTTAQHAAFAGAVGEVTIDTTLNKLRVHDGVTPGGFVAGNVASDIVASADKATPVDSDLLGLVDSAASNTLKKLSFANLKATLLAAWKDATGGLVGLTLFAINFKNTANTFTSYLTNSATASRTYTFQDASGTVAFLSDIGGGSAGITASPVINGGFTINQRVYVSGAALSAGTYGHDRWKAGASGGDYSFTQLASNTTITIAANKTLIQVVEDKNVQSTSYVLSWTGTALARVGVNSATPSGAYAASPITITGQTKGTTMSVEFGNGASAGTLGEVQLTPGASAGTFTQRSYGHELALCMRYYEKSYELGTAPGTATAAGFDFLYGTLDASSTALLRGVFKVPKRVAPTLTGYSTGGTVGQWTYAHSGAGATNAAVTLDSIGTGSFRAYVTASGGTAWAGAVLNGQWTASCEL